MTARDRLFVAVFVAVVLSAVVASIVLATGLDHESATHLVACESSDAVLHLP